MPDYEFPPDLLQQQLAFFAADTEVEKAAAALPSSVAKVAGTLTEEEKEKLPRQEKALADARAERDKLFAKLKANEWWGQPEQQRDPYAAWKALQAAAKALQAKTPQEETNP